MKAIFWDLDDTLLDSVQPRMDALAYAYQQCLGRQIDPAAVWRAHHGRTLESLGNELLGAEGHRFVEVYRAHYYESDHRIDAYTGIRDALTYTAAHGLRHAVVTSKVSWGAIDELTEAGLLTFFEAVVGYDDTELHKPDPEPIYSAMKRLSIDSPSDIVFIGDSPADMQAARNAGCRSVAALWGTLDRGLLLGADPDFQAETPTELGSVFNGLLLR